MDNAGKIELNAIISELNGIVISLESYQDSIKNGFIGIGQDTCASRIDSVLSSLRKAYKALNKIDTSKIAESIPLSTA